MIKSFPSFRISAPVLFSVLVSALPASGAFAADATADFSSSTNPNGVWTYGSLSSVSDTSLTVFTVASASPSPANQSGSINVWQASVGDGLPWVGKAGAAGWKCCSTVEVGAGALTLHPGNGLENYAVVQFTAIAPSVYQFSGSFWGQDNTAGSTDVHVLVGGASIWTANLTGPFAASQMFSNTVSLSAGQTLSFAVGRGSNNHFYDSTGLTATVTAVPEPGSLAMLLAGLGVVGSLARRRLQAAS